MELTPDLKNDGFSITDISEDDLDDFILVEKV